MSRLQSPSHSPTRSTRAPPDDNGLAVFHRVSNKVRNFIGSSSPDPFGHIPAAKLSSSSLPLMSPTLPADDSPPLLASSPSPVALSPLPDPKLPLPRRHRTFSASALALPYHISHDDYDEIHLPPAGPISVRRGSGLSRSSAESLASSATSVSNTNDASFSADKGSQSPVSTPHDEDDVAVTGVTIPESLQKGLTFLRITHRKRVQRSFVLDPEAGVVLWDTKSSSRFHIDRILEIHIARDARNYREELKVSAQHEPRWASIIYTKPQNNKLKALHIVAATQNEFDVFIDVLKQLVKHRRQIMSGLAMPGEKFVDVHWNKFVTTEDDGQQRLSFDNVEKLARRLHINCSKVFLESKFRQADVDNSGSLDFKEFQEFVRLLKWRGDIAMIFSDIADTRHGLSLSGLRHFIRDIQKQDMDDLAVEKIFTRFAKAKTCDCDCADSYLTVEEFSDLLMSSNFPPLHVDTDLSRPLNEYFISSSHNTYLLGRQVAGASSVEAYVRALQNGCRCVEIDVWDGDQGPIVCHGRRFTSSLEFADVVNIIRKYAFIASPYPLILSLEVRCNTENQLKMVETLKSLLGEHLVTKPIADDMVLPSPVDLKHRILLKVKSGGGPLANGEIDPLTGRTSSFSTDSSTWSATTESSMSASDDAGSSGLSQTLRSPVKAAAATPRAVKRRLKPPTRICDALGSLGVYVSGVTFRNFSLPVSKSPFHCFSLSERTVNSMLKDSVKNAQVMKHNRRFLMRVYPAVYRMKSTNFDPIPYWKCGIQMVALNWQTNDVGLQLSDAMFNATEGYVLKPDSYLADGPGGLSPNISSAGFSATSKLLRMSKSLLTSASTSLKPPVSTKMKVKVTVISCQQLPRPKELAPNESFDPYVMIELYGVENSILGDSDSTVAPVEAGSKWKTRTVIDNGFSPMWNSTWSVEIDRQAWPFVFVRFAVHCRETPFAVYTARLSYLNEGYRHVQLQDLQGEEYIFSTLFIRLEVD